MKSWKSGDKARKRFREEIRLRTRRQQPKNLEMVIKSINPVIRGWGNYFKCGTVKKSFGELDSYIRGRLRSFKAKKRTQKTILYTLPQSGLKKMGLVSLSSMLDDTISCKGRRQTKAAYVKSVRAVWWGDGGRKTSVLLYYPLNRYIIIIIWVKFKSLTPQLFRGYIPSYLSNLKIKY